MPDITEKKEDLTQNRPPIDLSILIVSWNSWPYLSQCLKSLESQKDDTITFEVIVVDNGSIDDTPDRVAQYFPWVRLIRNDYNYGFAKATNQAYQLSQGRYVMTLNPDTKLPAGSLKGIVDFLDSHPNVGAIQLWPAYTRFNRIHQFNIWKIIQDRLSLSSSESPPSSPSQVEWLWGTAITARRKVLGDKFYEEWCFLFCEEYDFCLRIRQMGYELYVLPFRIEHFLRGSRKVSAETQRITQHLAQAALFMMEVKEIGLPHARLNSLLKFIDGLILWNPLSILQFFIPNPNREKALIEWEALWKANLRLLFRGKAYFEQINPRSQQVPNDKQLLRKWLLKEEVGHV